MCLAAFAVGYVVEDVSCGLLAKRRRAKLEAELDSTDDI